MPSNRSSASSQPSAPQSDPKSRLLSKADPNLALYEDQPVAHMGYSGTGTFSLQSMQHRDREGRVITDPDLSNPTRHRFERPLDTIRGFQAAIEERHREQVFTR